MLTTEAQAATVSHVFQLCPSIYMRRSPRRWVAGFSVRAGDIGRWRRNREPGAPPERGEPAGEEAV